MSKLIDLEMAINMIKPNSTIMIGGFMANGSPIRIIDALVESGVNGLTLISNDTGFVDKGCGKMVVSKQFKKIIASHIGTNKETGRQMTEGEIEVELVPQGTLVERIRCGGYGLGGVLTKTGLGTLVAENKEHITVDEEVYLLEKPLVADVAVIYASKADKFGNLIYKGSENNFNNVMAAAAKVTIVEVGEILEVGELDPNQIITPGIFVDYIVRGE